MTRYIVRTPGHGGDWYLRYWIKGTNHAVWISSRERATEFATEAHAKAALVANRRHINRDKAATIVEIGA